MKVCRIITLAIAALLMLAACAAAESITPAKVGAQAPDFELTTLDGGRFALSENRGKVVLLNIWATWCPPCVSEMPDIQKLADAHPDDLAVIGVSVDDGTDEVNAFIEAYSLTYSFAMDEGYRLIGLLYPSEYIPESVFIDPNGIVTSMEVGSATYAQLEQRFQDALDNAAAGE